MQAIEEFSTKRENLHFLLNDFLKRFPNKAYFVNKFIKHISLYDDNRVFYRNFFEDGHFTAGILIFNVQMDKILLMHHKKTGKWHHFGGHADGEVDILEVALRELEEEGGIRLNKSQVEEKIISIDIHPFPQRGEEPEHLHYDINFLGHISENISFLKQEEEVNEIRWFYIDDLQIMADSKELPSGLIITLKNLSLIS